MAMQIFMTGEAGYHNIGDEGQALASADRLQFYFPDAHLIATAIDPLGAVLRHQADIVPWPLMPGDLHSSYPIRLIRKIAWKLRAPEDILDPIGKNLETIFDQQYRSNHRFQAVLKEMEQADFVFDMGHGALNDIFDPFMLCFLYYLAKRLSKPLFISGQSIGPLWRSRSLRMIRDTLDNAHTIGLRDKDISCHILIDQVGVDTNHLRLVEIGDDTLDLKPEEPCWNHFAKPLADVLRNNAFFAVQWRTSDYTKHIGVTEQLVPLIEVIQYLYRVTGLPAVFLPFSWEFGSSDILVGIRIQDYLSKERIPFYVLGNYLKAADLKWLMGKARFGIGLSYHFHVFLLSQGIPSIGLYTNPYYEIKLRGVFAAYDYSVEPLSYSSATTIQDPKLQKAISFITNWTDNDRCRLLMATAAQRKKWHEAFQVFLKDNGFVSQNQELLRSC